MLTLVPPRAVSVQRKARPSGLAERFSHALCAVDARTTRLAAWLGVVLVVRLCVPLATTLNVWLDEAFTLHTTAAGPGNAWWQAVNFEMQPPLYFVLEAVWRSWDAGSIAFARIPSVAFASIAVAVTVFAAHRLAPRVPPLLVAVMTAANPIVLWAATEMRVYALVLLIGAGLTWTFAEAFLIDRPSRKARIWYVVLAIAGLYTQYFVGFLLAAQFVTLLFVRRQALRPVVACLSIVALVFAPFVTVALMHVRSSGDSVTRVGAGRAAIEVASSLFAYVLPHELGWSGIGKFAGYAVAALLLMTLIAVGRPRMASPAARGVCVLWCVSALIFAGVFASSGVPTDTLRHLIVLAPLSQLAAFVLASSLCRRQAVIASVTVAVYAGFTVTQLWAQYTPPVTKLGDWQHAAALLSAETDSAPIAVFPAELALPLGVYSSKPVVPIPRPMPFTVDYVHATTLTGTADVARVLDPVRRGSDRLWLVTNGTCAAAQAQAYDYHCTYLEIYLRAHYRTLRRVALRGTLLRLYARIPEAGS